LYTRGLIGSGSRLGVSATFCTLSVPTVPEPRSSATEDFPPPTRRESSHQDDLSRIEPIWTAVVAGLSGRVAPSPPSGDGSMLQWSGTRANTATACQPCSARRRTPARSLTLTYKEKPARPQWAAPAVSVECRPKGRPRCLRPSESWSVLRPARAVHRPLR
jgi:hypothetical protein